LIRSGEGEATPKTYSDDLRERVAKRAGSPRVRQPQVRTSGAVPTQLHGATQRAGGWTSSSSHV